MAALFCVKCIARFVETQVERGNKKEEQFWKASDFFAPDFVHGLFSNEILKKKIYALNSGKEGVSFIIIRQA
jgi:hypothetical protein